MLSHNQNTLIKNGKKPKLQLQQVQLPRMESNESLLDMSLLDVMGVDDFLHLLKNKTDSNTKELWKEVFVLATQLKASRELLSIGSNLFSHRATAKILERLVEASYVVLNAERVYLLEIDAITGRDLIVTHSREKNAISQRISAESGIEADVISRKICANVPDVTQDSRFSPGLDSKLQQKTRCMICAPIVADGVVLGVIEAVNKRAPLATPRSARDTVTAATSAVSRDTALTSNLSNAASFSANEALLLSFIAANAGLALSSLCASANAPHQQILPAHVSVEMYRAPDPFAGRSLAGNPAIKALWNAAYEKLHAERVSVFMYDPQSRCLLCVLSQDIEGLSVPCDKGFAGLCFNSRRIVNISDAPDDSRHNNEIDTRVGFNTKKLLCAPILMPDTGNAIGVIQAVNKKDDNSAFGTADEESIISVSSDIVKLLLEQGLDLEKFLEEESQFAAVDAGHVQTAIPLQQMAPSSSSTAAATARSLNSALPLDFELAFARCMGSMMLARSVQELVKEFELTIRTLTTCDFIGVYVLCKGKLRRIHSRMDPASTAAAIASSGEAALKGADEDTEAANAALTLAGALPPNPTIAASTDDDIASCAAGGDVITMSDMPVQMKQALQFSTIVEFALPTANSSAGQPRYLLPDLPVQQALIIPIASKMPGSYEPGSCVLVVGKTSKLGATVASMRSIIEAVSENFNAAVVSLSQQLADQESTQRLRSQFHLLNNSLAALRDYVVLLDKEGKFVASNKCVEDLLGGPNCHFTSSKPSTPSKASTAPLVAVTEGKLYTEWLTNGNSPELLRDIASVLSTGTARSLDRVKFFSAVHPEGILVDYQVVPIANPIDSSSFRSNSKTVVERSKPLQNLVFGSVGGNSLSSSGSAYSNKSMRRLTRGDSLEKLPAMKEHEGLAHSSVLLVIHTENFHHHKTLGPSASSHMKLATLANLPMNLLDSETAHGVVDAATTIVNNVRNSYSLSADLEETLKSITYSLNNASRKLSIMETSRSSMSNALLSNTILLVNNAEIIPPDLFEWEFNVLTITDGLHLCNIIGKLFESLCNLDSMDIDRFCLARYIAEVGKNYHDRPFHNLQHATCVTHFTYKLISATKAAENLSNFQVFAIMISAVVHDVDHPGNTNLFEVNSASELALRYNDQAVLENHHCSTAFRLMRKPNTQVLATLPQQMVAVIRKTIISCVMATDMAVHFDLIDETKRKAQSGFKFEEEKDRFFLGKILLHAADLSNPVRPYHMTKEWASRISMEFNDQVNREKALGMPVLGFMVTPDEKAFCKNEIGFASFVVAPMWRALALVYPSLDFLVQQLDGNLGVWKQSLAEIEAQEAASSNSSSSNSNSSGGGNSEEKLSSQKT